MIEHYRSAGKRMIVFHVLHMFSVPLHRFIQFCLNRHSSYERQIHGLVRIEQRWVFVIFECTLIETELQNSISVTMMVPLVLSDCSLCCWIWSIDFRLRMFSLLIVSCDDWLLFLWMSSLTSSSSSSLLPLVLYLYFTSRLACPLHFIVFFAHIPPFPSRLLHVLLSILSLSQILLPYAVPHILFSLPHLLIFTSPPSFFHVSSSTYSPSCHLSSLLSPPQPPPLPAPSLCREARHCRASPCWIPTTRVRTCIHTHKHTFTLHTHI